MSVMQVKCTQNEQNKPNNIVQIALLVTSIVSQHQTHPYAFNYKLPNKWSSKHIRRFITRR